MDKNCSVYKTADFIGKRWTMLILLELYKADGKIRYSEIKKKLLNITPKILSSRLKELEKQGMVKKKVDTSSMPIKSNYSLTEGGKDFFKIIKSLKRWSIKWKVRNEYCEKTNCAQCKY
jgi:DNA-binding HxlR family transcriptional regulator